MQLERKHIIEDDKKRKMVHIKAKTHTQIVRLAAETGYSVTDLTDILLCDALARVELIDEKSEDKNGNCTKRNDDSTSLEKR